jgi:pilus assembly protein CpaB
MTRLKLNRNWAVLGVALAVGLIAAFSVQRYIRERVEAAQPAAVDAQTVDIVVAATQLSQGDRLSSANLAVRKVPKEWVHSNALRPRDFEEIENKAMLTTALAGEPILQAQVEGQRDANFSASLSNGRRAVTVPVDEISSSSGLLVPGDAIDLILSVRHEGKVKLLPVMQDVKVMATGTQVQHGQGRNKDENRTFSTVTLNTTPEEARRIMAAREVGKVTALLRAPGDAAQQAPRTEDALALLGVARATGSGGRAAVQVLYGGRSSDAARPLTETRHAAGEPRADSTALD